MPKLITAFRLLKTPRKFLSVLIIRLAPIRPFMRLIYWWHDRRDRRTVLRSPFSCVPPTSLRFRVSGGVDLEGFLENGQMGCQDLKKALAKAGKKVEDFASILDFGCGCGRMLLWLMPQAPDAQFYGTDIDAEVIAWCDRCLKGAHLQTNQPSPPLNYPAEMFDFVYANSVFTHIDEDAQFRWLAELQRILKPEGILLLTVCGAHIWSNLPDEEAAIVKEKGFLFLPTRGGRADGPFHTKEYVFQNFSRYFGVLDYLPQGMLDHQDVVVLQKRRADRSLDGQHDSG